MVDERTDGDDQGALRGYAAMATSLAHAERHLPPKRAEVLASRIEDEIISSGWRVGHRLGAEPELVKRYGVSRQVMREATRILEHHMVARMRRGAFGGLVVTAPDPWTVVTAAARYLDFERAGSEHLYHARSALELTALDLVLERLDERSIARIRATVESEAGHTAEEIALRGNDFHLVLVDLTGDPVLMLFVQVLLQLTSDRSLPAVRNVSKRILHKSRKDHVEIADAIVSGDADRARDLMRTHLEWIARRQGRPRIDRSNHSRR